MGNLEELVVDGPVAIRYKSLLVRLLVDVERAAHDEPATAASALLDLSVLKELCVDMVLRGLYSTVDDVEEQLRTLEQLIDDQLKWTSLRRPMRTGPLFQHVGRLALEEARTRFEAEDPAAVMLAMATCARHDMVAPRWAADAFVAAYQKFDDGYARSWDEAFGRPLPSGRKVSKRRKDKALGDQLLLFVAMQRLDGHSVGPAMWEMAGSELGMGPRQASELYYSSRQRLAARMLLPGISKK